MTGNYPQYNYSIYLEFLHPFRRPEEFTAALRREPDRCWDKGTSRTTAGGQLLPSRNTENHWFAELTNACNFEAAGLEKILATQLNEFEPQKSFFQSLRSEGGTSKISIYWNFHYKITETSLSLTMMTRLVEFGFDLDLHDIG